MQYGAKDLMHIAQKLADIVEVEQDEGRMLSSFSILEMLIENIRSVREEVYDMEDQIETAEYMGLHPEEQVRIIQAFDKSYFEIDPWEHKWLQKKIDMLDSFAGSLWDRTVALYEEAYEMTEISNQTNPYDDSFLDSLIFGTGILSVMFDSHVDVSSFQIEYDHFTECFHIHHDEPERYYFRSHKDELSDLIDKSFMTVMVRPEVTEDVDTLMKIAADKYLEVFKHSEGYMMQYEESDSR